MIEFYQEFTSSGRQDSGGLAVLQARRGINEKSRCAGVFTALDKDAYLTILGRTTIVE